MMSLADQKKRLEQVKRELNLDVYYRVDTTTYNGQPVLINEVNEYAYRKDGKRYNKHTGFKSVLMTQKDDDNLFELRLMWKKDMRAIFLIKNIELQDCKEWMKQLFSCGRLILNGMHKTPTSLDEILRHPAYFEQKARLKKWKEEHFAPHVDEE